MLDAITRWLTIVIIIFLSVLGGSIALNIYFIFRYVL
jgi:hypothetical protein